jgi:peptide/nickel transport system substrate-binding protein
MFRNRLYRLAAALAFALAASVGCSDTAVDRADSGDDLPQAERYGGTAVIGIPSDLQSMTSLVSSDANSRDVQEYLLLMPLVRFDEKLEPVPWLAERWDTVRIGPETLEVTFHLRRDVYWHDGVQTTADDVRFTFDRAIDPATAFPNRSAFDLWSREAEVIDSFTVRLTVRPHADFLDAWRLPILPAHILAEVPPEELLRHPFGTVSPVGNGPFRFLRRVPNQEWAFEANPEFPLGLGGRPYLDRLVFRVIPEQTALLTELLTGRIDVYPAPNPAQASQIEAADGVTLLSSSNRAYTYIGWNTRLPLFDDPRERRALSLAIDREALVSALLYGYGEPGVSTSSPAHWAFDVQKDLRPAHDPEAARALLREAGWQDRDGDGILENADGVPFRFTLMTNQGNDMRRDVGEIVQAQLRSIGVAVEPRTLEWNTMVSLLDGSINARGERERGFQAVTSGWTENFRKDDAPILHSRNLNEPFQETGFSNPRIDTLIDTLNLIVDRDEARPLWAEYHRLLLEEGPYAVLYYPMRLLSHRDRLRGVEIDVRSDWVSVQRWWLTR